MALGNNIRKKAIKSQPTVSEVANETEPVSVQEKSDIKVAEKPTINLIKEVKENKEVEVIKKTHYCVFSAGKEEYAIPIDIVKEVVKYSEPAAIPQMPSFIIGMSNVRGNIYGVLDLDIFFQGQTREAEYKYLIVLDHDIYKMAIRIKNVPDSLIVEDDILEELNSSTFKSVIGQKYLRGIIKKDNRMIILFDILGMVSNEEFTEINV